MRKGVRTILEAHPGYEVCAEAENGADVERLIAETNPDVVVLDITMPVKNGLDAAREILEKRPNLPIVILSMHDSGGQLEAAKKIGVKAYVSKSRAATNLIQAIDAVMKGETYFPPLKN